MGPTSKERQGMVGRGGKAKGLLLREGMDESGVGKGGGGNSRKVKVSRINTEFVPRSATIAATPCFYLPRV